MRKLIMFLPHTLCDNRIIGQKVKLVPRFINSFEILNKIKPITYRLAFPLTLNNIQDVLHA